MNTGDYQQLVEFFATQFSNYGRRFDGLRDMLRGQFQEIQGHFGELEIRLENLRQQMAGFRAQISELERRIRP